jgi:hypothetical protein
MSKKISLSILCLFSIGLLHGQSSPGIEDATSLAHMTVQAPTVANLFKFSDVPVNLSNGSVNASIPIYTIQVGSIKWPVTLTYNTGGIRVNENSGNVGLGWNIDAEGAIMQSVQGWKDNGNDYMDLNGTTWDNAAIIPDNPENYSLLNVLSTAADGAPDLFVYNLHNQSGKFMITDEVKLLPKKNIEFSTYNNANAAKNWKVVDQSGVVYYFEDIEVNENRSYGNSTSSSNTWYLSKVVDPVTGDSLIFEYENMFMTYSTGTNFEVNCWTSTTNIGWEWTMAPGDPPIPGLMTSGVQNTDGKQLKRIRFPEGSIEYDISWNTREDWGTNPTTGHIPQVKNVFVKNLAGDILKTIHFDQSYFSTGTETSKKRMRLDSVSIADNLTNALSNPVEKYKLKYSTLSMPAKNSFAIDHWGYYNGKNTNVTLIPSFKASGFNYIGADRNTSPTYCGAGMLEKITYPTGGSSAFTWEPHVYHTLEPATPIDSIILGQIIGSGPDWIDQMAGSEITTIPYTNLFNNLHATLSVSGGYPAGANSQSINHAAHSVTLYEVNGSALTMIRNLGLSYNALGNYTKTATVLLQKGKSYKIVIRTQGGSGYSVVGKLEFDWPVEGTTSVTNYVGGCRIAKIVTHDINSPNDIVKKYEYSDVQVYTMPEYGYLQYKYYALDDNTGAGGDGHVPCSEIELPGWHLTSNSISNIGSGNHVGYSSVKEIYGANGEGGSKINYFTNFDGQNVGEVDASWRHGIPTKEETYDAVGNLVAEVDYHNKRSTLEHYAGHSASSCGAHPCSNGFDLYNILLYPAHWNQKVYDYPIDWLYTDSVESIDYGTGIHNLSITGYDNPNHMQPTRKSIFTTDNKKITTFIQYPTDFEITSATTQELDGIKLLQDNHMHNVPIETYTQQLLPGSSTPMTLFAMQNEYVRSNSNIPGGTSNIPLLKTVKKVEIPGEGINNFYPMDIAYNTIIKDPKYVVKALAVKYDGYHNLEKLQLAGNINSCALWGYGGKLTIAAIKNIDTSKQAAFTSFEKEASGNWHYNESAVVATDYFTGSRSINIGTSNGIYLLAPTNTLALPAGPPSAAITGSYIVSYWHKNGSVLVNGNGPDLTGITANGWTYCEHYLTGAITTLSFTGTGLLDELRLYPLGTLMNTYTYKPLVGVTSMNDETNNLIFYEYDGIGRLKFEKDVFGKILKSYDYQTQGAQ